MKFHQKPVTFVSHVKIKVGNLERSVEFYEKMLGFSVLEKTSSEAKLTADGKTGCLTLIEPENVIPKQAKTTGLYHFAILLPTAKDLANIVVHLARNGIPFGSSDHLVSEAIYLSDPDGNGIEIYRDRPPSGWHWQGGEVKMAVDPLDFETLLKHASPDNPWEKLPKETVIGHIHLHVAELSTAEKFYVEGLGMDVVNRFGTEALFFSYGKYHHHIGINTWNGVGAPPPAPNSTGLESFTLLFADEKARQQAVGNLRKIGAEVKEEGNHFITFDPSGNCIELVV